MDNLKLSIAVVSDLHCSSKQLDRKSTYLDTSVHRNPKQHHPVEALKSLIEDSEMEFAESKILLCPGDITDKIDLTGFNFGWNCLEEIARKLNNSDIIASIGNHDLDSRGVHSLDQTEKNYSAKNLSDNYPFVGDKSKFWADNFSGVRRGDFYILNINTCLNHLNPEEDKFGKLVISSKLDTSVLLKIEDEIKNLDSNLFKITLLHHHPSQYSDIHLSSYSDADILQGGDVLLDLLNKYNFDLVIHGHKHVPRFNDHDGLPIFCSGSFSSIMNLQESNSKNTFHLVNFYRKKYKGNDYRVGEILTWEFNKGLGWMKPTSHLSKIRHRSGFGFTPDISSLSKDIGEFLLNNPIVKISELDNEFFEFKYSHPKFRNRIFEKLKVDYEYSLSIKENGDLILVKD